MAKTKKIGRFLELTSQGLLKEIDQKLESCKRSSDYRIFIAKSYTNSLECMSNLLAWCKHEDILEDNINESDYDKDRTLKLKARQARDQIFEAWGYLRGAVGYLKQPTFQALRKNLFLDLGRHINSELNFRFRQVGERAECFSPEYSPPAGEQVDLEIDKFLSYLKNPKIHPVSRAAFAHLAVVAIQPFRSGNKRIGRLLQDSILADAILPAALIYPGEKETYCALLRPAVVGFALEDSASQTAFYNYIAGKVNMGLDRFGERN